MQKIILLCLLLLSGSIAKSQNPFGTLTAAAFEHNMSIRAQVVTDGAADNAPGNVVAVFVGAQLRGLGVTVAAGGTLYHDLTVYSNSFSGETLEFRVFKPATGLEHPAAETAVFRKNDALGRAAAPFALTTGTDNDFPPALAVFPDFEVETPAAFDTIFLNDYLQSVDDDAVVWSVNAGANLTAQIFPGNKLVVKPAVPGWTGTSTVALTVSETGTTVLHNTAATLNFSIAVAVAAPDFNAQIPA